METLKGKRIVITGATGFIGRNTAQLFLDAGAIVFAVVRGESKQLDKLPHHENLHQIVGTIQDIDRCLPDIGYADGFIHFAWGGVNRAEIDSPVVQAKNISGSIKCVEAAAKLGCNIFMDAGSRAEYGICPNGKMEESMECHPINEYGKAKLEFYKQASSLCKEMNMTYYHLRFFSVFGSGDHPWSIISTLTRELPKGNTVSLSACLHQWNFMDIEDASRAVVELYRYCEKHRGEIHIVNIASQNTRILKEFVEDIHQTCEGKGVLKYGTFSQGKEGALSICPETVVLQKLTEGTWREQVPFSVGIKKILENDN